MAHRDLVSRLLSYVSTVATEKLTLFTLCNCFIYIKCFASTVGTAGNTAVRPPPAVNGNTSLFTLTII